MIDLACILMGMLALAAGDAECWSLGRKIALLGLGGILLDYGVWCFLGNYWGVLLHEVFH